MVTLPEVAIAHSAETTADPLMQLLQMAFSAAWLLMALIFFLLIAAAGWIAERHGKTRFGMRFRSIRENKDLWRQAHLALRLPLAVGGCLYALGAALVLLFPGIIRPPHAYLHGAAIAGIAALFFIWSWLLVRQLSRKEKE